MKRRQPVSAEAAAVRRGYYLLTVAMVTIIAVFLSIFVASGLKKQNESDRNRLRTALIDANKAFIKDAIDRTVGEIDLERRLERERLGLPAGDGPGAAEADEAVKRRMKVRIRETALRDQGYIWVNEVLDYDGGPGFARRLVHRALPHTEGTLLSTNDSDGQGHYHYAMELAGVKSYGAVFSQYYFLKPGTQRPVLKLGYSRLYADFDWILGTGIYLDDLEAMLEEEERLAAGQQRTQLRTSMLGILFALAGVFTIIVIVDKLTARIINASYRRIAAGEAALLEEKRKVEEAYAIMKELAERDALTGLRNRRSGMEILEVEMARARRSGLTFSVGMLDVDRFKPVNDTYGHDAGDVVLVAVAETMEACLRAEDLATRWGGEEFLIAFSGDGIDAAKAAAERVRAAIAARTVEYEGVGISVTVTIGLAQFHPREDLAALVKRADEAMYAGKVAGRDRIAVAPPFAAASGEA